MQQPIVQAFFERYRAVIDPVLDCDRKASRTSTTHADKVIGFVRDQRLQVQWILEMHAHADHLSAAHHLRRKPGGRIAIGEHIRTVQAERRHNRPCLTIGRCGNSSGQLAGSPKCVCHILVRVGITYAASPELKARIASR